MKQVIRGIKREGERKVERERERESERERLLPFGITPIACNTVKILVVFPQPHGSTVPRFCVFFESV